MMLFARRLILAAVVTVPTAAWAAHPLITDDTGTQGKGKSQLEINGQYDYDRETVDGASMKSTGGQAALAFSYGVVENADLILGAPYAWSTVRENGVIISDAQGISDTTVELKWRFLENDGLSLALKPGVSIPTGDENKGLGTGKTGYHVFFIGSREVGPWEFLVNLGYVRNENRVEERTDVWHASLAVIYEVVERLKAVGNIGIERNSDMTSDNDPAFLLGGVIYSATKNFDIDFGVKGALTASETDISLLAGTAFRF